MQEKIRPQKSWDNLLTEPGAEGVTGALEFIKFQETATIKTASGEHLKKSLTTLEFVRNSRKRKSVHVAM